jgi:hypothetical protein
MTHFSSFARRNISIRVLGGWVVLMAAGLPLAGQTVTIDLTSSADTYIRDDSTTRGTMEFMDIRGSFSPDFHGYVRFDLPSDILSILDASIVLTKVAGSRNDAINNGRFRLWGLLDEAGNTPQNWIESGEGALNTLTVGAENRSTGSGLVNLDGSLDISELISGNTITVSGVPLTAFLQSRADAGGSATFIIDFSDLASDRGYGIASRENTSGAALPTLSLEYTAVPEPSALGLLVGLGALSGLLLRRRR